MLPARRIGVRVIVRPRVIATIRPGRAGCAAAALAAARRICAADASEGRRAPPPTVDTIANVIASA
jgi:hypothetical protein